MQRLLIFVEKSKRILMPRKIGKYAFLTVVSSLIYGIVFSYFTILRNNSFYSAAWDLGNFNQAFYTTLFNGRLFHYTADVFFSPSGSVFAIHTSPFLFLLIPFYAMRPSPETLLVLKAFAIGFAAVPLYLVAKHLLEDSKAGFVMALVYLLYAPLQGANWFDFQQSAFLAIFLFLTYFFMIKRNWKLYFPIMLLTLLIEEYAAVVVAILAIYYFSYTSSLKSIPKSLKELRMNDSLASILTVVLCATYFLIAFLIKNSFPVNPVFAELYKASSNFRILGSSDTITFPIYALLNLQRTFNALSYDFAYKFFYVIFLLAPVLFIPLRNRFFLGIAFIFLPFILSNYRYYYTLGIHYPFYIIPMIFIAAIYGIRRLDPKARIFNLRTMIVVTLLFAICISPLSPISNVFVQQGTAYYSPIQLSLNENEKSLNDLLNLIPPNASILTQNVIFPHVSNRLNAYVIPFSDYGKPTEMGQYIDQIIYNSEYVLLDMTSMNDMDKRVLEIITSSNTYGAFALGTQAILFKRGFHDEPFNGDYTSNRTFLAYRDLFVSSPPGIVVNDSSSSSGRVFFYPKGSPGDCIYGPYTYLLAGSYQAVFTVKSGEHGEGWLGTFDVTSDDASQVLSFRDLYGLELKTADWVNITIPFSLPKLATGIEFRFHTQGNADLFFDTVKLQRITSSATSRASMITIRPTDLQLSSGILNKDEFLQHQKGATNEVFWFGPYWNFAIGNYSATFALHIEPTVQEQGGRVLTLSISGKLAEAGQPILLNEKTLYTQDFSGSDWQMFRVEFTVRQPMIGLEFRGLFPSPNYDVYLAFIIVEGLD
jgi:uncharacterized membrane protein